MHYFITASVDSYISENSPSYITQHPDSITKNYGGDAILELNKTFFDRYDTSSFSVSRILIKFNYSDVSSSIVSGHITNPRYYLRLYEIEGQKELNKSYTLQAFPLSQSWVEGVGKKFDNPKVQEGVTWTDYDSGSAWSATLGQNSYSGSRTKSLGGGIWMTGSGYEASQSFTNVSGDVEMEITDAVKKHLGGTNQISNNGFLIKFSGSVENDVASNNLKFFSKQTHTIYQPKLEVRWDDHKPCTGSNTGSMNELTMSGELKNHVFIKGLRKNYRETEKVRFRLGCRKNNVQKTFKESALTSSFYVSEGSGSYSILDVSTNTSVVPFSAYTTMSCDTTSMYFDQWLNTFEPGRYYKILFKLRYNDGQESIIDNNEEFKII